MSRTVSTGIGERWSLEDVDHLVLHGVSWELYEHLLREIGERPLRITYDNGELEIMSPLPEHVAAMSKADTVEPSQNCVLATCCLSSMWLKKPATRRRHSKLFALGC